MSNEDENRNSGGHGGVEASQMASEMEISEHHSPIAQIAMDKTVRTSGEESPIIDVTSNVPVDDPHFSAVASAGMNDTTGRSDPRLPEKSNGAESNLANGAMEPTESINLKKMTIDQSDIGTTQRDSGMAQRETNDGTKQCETTEGDREENDATEHTGLENSDKDPGEENPVAVEAEKSLLGEILRNENQVAGKEFQQNNPSMRDIAAEGGDRIIDATDFNLRSILRTAEMERDNRDPGCPKVDTILSGQTQSLELPPDSGKLDAQQMFLVDVESRLQDFCLSLIRPSIERVNAVWADIGQMRREAQEDRKKIQAHLDIHSWKERVTARLEIFEQSIQGGLEEFQSKLLEMTERHRSAVNDDLKNIQAQLGEVHRIVGLKSQVEAISNKIRNMEDQRLEQERNLREETARVESLVWRLHEEHEQAIEKLFRGDDDEEEKNSQSGLDTGTESGSDAVGKKTNDTLEQPFQGADGEDIITPLPITGLSSIPLPLTLAKTHRRSADEKSETMSIGSRRSSVGRSSIAGRSSVMGRAGGGKVTPALMEELSKFASRLKDLEEDCDVLFDEKADINNIVTMMDEMKSTITDELVQLLETTFESGVVEEMVEKCFERIFMGASGSPSILGASGTTSAQSGAAACLARRDSFKTGRRDSFNAGLRDSQMSNQGQNLGTLILHRLSRNVATNLFSDGSKGSGLLNERVKALIDLQAPKSPKVGNSPKNAADGDKGPNIPNSNDDGNVMNNSPNSGNIGTGIPDEETNHKIFQISNAVYQLAKITQSQMNAIGRFSCVQFPELLLGEIERMEGETRHEICSINRALCEVIQLTAMSVAWENGMLKRRSMEDDQSEPFYGHSSRGVEGLGSREHLGVSLGRGSRSGGIKTRTESKDVILQVGRDCLTKMELISKQMRMLDRAIAQVENLHTGRGDYEDQDAAAEGEDHFSDWPLDLKDRIFGAKNGVDKLSCFEQLIKSLGHDEDLIRRVRASVPSLPPDNRRNSSTDPTVSMTASRDVNASTSVAVSSRASLTGASNTRNPRFDEKLNTRSAELYTMLDRSNERVLQIMLQFLKSTSNRRSSLRRGSAGSFAGSPIGSPMFPNGSSMFPTDPIDSKGVIRTVSDMLNARNNAGTSSLAQAIRGNSPPGDKSKQISVIGKQSTSRSPSGGRKGKSVTWTEKRRQSPMAAGDDPDYEGLWNKDGMNAGGENPARHSVSRLYRMRKSNNDKQAVNYSRFSTQRRNLSQSNLMGSESVKRIRRQSTSADRQHTDKSLSLGLNQAIRYNGWKKIEDGSQRESKYGGEAKSQVKSEYSEAKSQQKSEYSEAKSQQKSEYSEARARRESKYGEPGETSRKSRYGETSRKSQHDQPTSPSGIFGPRVEEPVLKRSSLTQRSSITQSSLLKQPAFQIENKQQRKTANSLTARTRQLISDLKTGGIGASTTMGDFWGGGMPSTNFVQSRYGNIFDGDQRMVSSNQASRKSLATEDSWFFSDAEESQSSKRKKQRKDNDSEGASDNSEGYDYSKYPVREEAKSSSSFVYAGGSKETVEQSQPIVLPGFLPADKLYQSISPIRPAKKTSQKRTFDSDFTSSKETSDVIVSTNLSPRTQKSVESTSLGSAGGNPQATMKHTVTLLQEETSMRKASMEFGGGDFLLDSGEKRFSIDDPLSSMSMDCFASFRRNSIGSKDMSADSKGMSVDSKDVSGINQSQSVDTNNERSDIIRRTPSKRTDGHGRVYERKSTNSKEVFGIQGTSMRKKSKPENEVESHAAGQPNDKIAGEPAKGPENTAEQPGDNPPQGHNQTVEASDAQKTDDNQKE